MGSKKSTITTKNGVIHSFVYCTACTNDSRIAFTGAIPVVPDCRMLFPGEHILMPNPIIRKTPGIICCHFIFLFTKANKNTVPITASSPVVYWLPPTISASREAPIA